jgi:hypothetical protein
MDMIRRRCGVWRAGALQIVQDFRGSFVNLWPLPLTGAAGGAYSGLSYPAKLLKRAKRRYRMEINGHDTA